MTLGVTRGAVPKAVWSATPEVAPRVTLTAIFGAIREVVCGSNVIPERWRA